MTERSGVEIDYCPQCRGVWLDRGELDKIIAFSTSGRMPSGSRHDDDDDFEDRSRDRRRSDYHDDDDTRGRRKKRGGWLGELFEFGD
jgi:Zn-finger nucleic acid-binding protein